MYLIQIFLVLFFFFAILKVAGRYRAGDIPLSAAVAWIIFWLAAAVIVIIPNSTAYFAKIFGIGRGADLVVYLSLALLFFIIFRLMVKVEKLNKEITVLVRQMALKNKDIK
jgi:small membrane protein